MFSSKFFFWIHLVILAVDSSLIDNEIDRCNLPNDIIKEIRNYKRIVDRITNSAISGEYKGATYNQLATFIDKFGNRIAGSENLENAIDYMLDLSKRKGLENVHAEEALVPHWVRGEESATLLKPRRQNLAMLGLGSSIATPPNGITAQAIVVTSFDELENRSSEIQGKIVVYAEDYIDYGTSVAYRDYGASKASKGGALATLIRSITPFSLNNPHTGWQDYDSDVPKIPTACITVEDAHMLKRMQDRGDQIVISLRMSAQNLPPKVSRNSIMEIQGRSNPNKVVVISGHLDSWDVGQGAMDDGGGFMLSWSSAVLLKSLNLQARRTIRSILWTAEEEGLVGSQAYVKNHKNESENFNFVMESDSGTFTPSGLSYFGISETGCILQEILRLFENINATKLTHRDDGPDLIFWDQMGIPGASLLTEAQKYFWFHHSAADTMDVENDVDLDKATALWASVAYIIADLSFDIPRKPTA